MPTYLYECENCGRFEEFQKITEDSLETCPKCNASVKRIIGAPGIIFKGSGFYSTDAKSSSNTINAKDTKNKSNDDVKAKSEVKKDKKDNKEKAS
ncbi:FmdB family zinc ribbon protein [Natronospora cellulosivora (SeqCode)]